jgi:hypothetical protein
MPALEANIMVADIMRRTLFISQEPVGLPQIIALMKNLASYDAPGPTIMARSRVPISPDKSFNPVFRQTPGSLHIPLFVELDTLCCNFSAICNESAHDFSLLITIDIPYCLGLLSSEKMSKLLHLLTIRGEGADAALIPCKIFVDKEAAFMYDNLNT